MAISKIEPASLQYQAGTGPAFRALPSGAQTITTATFTKLQFGTEEFDTNSNYDTSTYRFTPTVAGYYNVIASSRDATGATAGQLVTAIYKNGTAYTKSAQTNTVQGLSAINSTLVYMNGTTDYLESYVFQNSGSNMSIGNDTTFVYFTGCLVRAA